MCKLKCKQNIKIVFFSRSFILRLSASGLSSFLYGNYVLEKKIKFNKRIKSTYQHNNHTLAREISAHNANNYQLHRFAHTLHRNDRPATEISASTNKVTNYAISLRTLLNLWKKT